MTPLFHNLVLPSFSLLSFSFGVLDLALVSLFPPPPPPPPLFLFFFPSLPPPPPSPAVRLMPVTRGLESFQLCVYRSIYPPHFQCIQRSYWRIVLCPKLVFVIYVLFFPSPLPQFAPSRSNSSPIAK